MKRFVVALAAMILSGGAYALPISFTASYNVVANTSDPGLVIQTADEAPNPFSFDLGYVGDTTSFDLFKIWTDESSVNSTDDEDPKPITVNFAFTSPLSFGGAGSGTTFGTRGLFHEGNVDWAPNSFALGFGNGGLLGVYLEDETFNTGFLGLTPNFEVLGFEVFNGAKVKAKFELLAEAAPEEPTAVPEPATLLLLALGLLSIGLIQRRLAA